MTRFIAFASGKGGTGKTVTALNLGIALNSLSKKVIVVDGNITSPHVGLHLGAAIVPNTLNDALDGRAHIKDATYQHSSGLRIIPSSLSYDRIREAKIENMNNLMLDLVGMGDYVLIDCPSGLNKESWHTIGSADEVIIVTNPETSALTDALRTIKYSEEIGTRVVGVILTKVKGTEHEATTSEVLQLLEKPIIGIIPEDNNVHHSLKLKHPIMLTHPESPASIAYMRLAKMISEGTYKKMLLDTEEKSLFDSMMKGMRR
jgi:septum site-determining protein MinD